ncbi:hypothetical protein ACHAXR_008544 [Thalassiosira sp. AJA248-18]
MSLGILSITAITAAAAAAAAMTTAAVVDPSIIAAASDSVRVSGSSADPLPPSSTIINANSRYVSVESSPSSLTSYSTSITARDTSSNSSSSNSSGGAGLRQSMNKLTEALSDTRRILDGDNVVGVVNNTNNKQEQEQEEKVDKKSESENNAADNNGNENNNDSTSVIVPNNITDNNSGININNNNKQHHHHHHHHSSDWWERLYQGGPLYDQSTGKQLFMDDEDDNNDNIDNKDGATINPSSLIRPPNRRSHSATVYKKDTTNANNNNNTNNNNNHEWMIISGGFTDDDWNTFPVWAYDLTHSRSISEIEYEIIGGGSGNSMDGSMDNDNEEEMYNHGKSPWMDLTRLGEADTEQQEEEEEEDGTTKKDAEATTESSSSSKQHSNNNNNNNNYNIPPQGRVGHLSSIHNGCLYIFGGLTYRLGAFHVDYGSDDTTNNGDKGGGGDTIAIWKACGLDDMLLLGNNNVKGGSGGNNNGRGGSGGGGLKWERVSATVDSRPPERQATVDYATNDKEDDDDDDDSANRRILRGHNTRRRADVAADTTTSRHEHDNAAANSNNFRNDTTTTNTTTTNTIKPHQQTMRNEAIKPFFTLPRGEAQGGHYPQNTHNNNNDDCFVFYGGMHHHHSLTETSLEATTILGDVWKFDYESETLSLLSPYPPLPWQRDERNGDYPKARTAHAATIVDNELIIHGGMHFGEEQDQNNPESFSSPSNTYATYRTASSWKALSDVWVFDLVTLKWKERIMYPQLARSYHSMVGRNNGTVGIFGGFQQDNNLPGETIAFVFKDLLVSRPNETYWDKLQPPFDESITHTWRASPEYTARPGITNRLEHSAVLDQDGRMYIWGGRFQTVQQIVGMWRIDVFTDDAKLKWEVAPPDGIDQYEAELEALHMFIFTMLFTSLTISSLFSMLRRQGAEVEDGGGGGGGGRSLMGRRGLSRQVIDSIPLKRYEAMHTEVTDDGDVVEDVSLSRENSRDESLQLEENLDCCPICLVPYEDGVSEIRTLPCGHVFDRECIDAWFADHTTCPSCRQNIGDAPLPSAEEEGAPSINEQYDFDPRLQFLTAFDATRRRHSHWTGVEESADVTDDVSSENSNNESSNTHDDGHHQFDSTRPRFLGIRRFFSRSGHVGVAVPGDEETENIESIELV